MQANSKKNTNWK